MDNANANPIPAERPPDRWNPLALVLLILAVEAVVLVLCDALMAVAAKGRGSAPQFLFSWIAPMIVGGEGRFVSLAKMLALPALAIGLPALLAVLVLWLRKTAGAGTAGLRPSLAIAVAVLAVGIFGDGVLYGALAARPKNSSETAGPVRHEPKAAEGTTTVAPTPIPTPTPTQTPTPAAGEERILFSSDRDGQWQLWMMKPDGSGQEKFTKTDRIHMEPRRSPDGTRVAFSSGNSKGQHVICTFDFVTGEEKEICEGDQGAFTGDGQALVLRRDDKIFQRDLASGAEKQLSPAMWTRCSYPSAAPDGSGLALASRLLAGYNIYILPTGGGDPKLLIGGEGTCDPRWAPSGKQLSFQTETHIFTIKPDGTDKLQVTFGGGVQHYACFSPDEKRMAYCQGPGRDGPWQIYTVALDKDEDPALLAKEGSNMYPEWGRIRLTK